MPATDRFFVDSNVLLYYVDPQDEAKRELAIRWLNHLWLTGAGAISWQVLNEFYWNAVRKMRLDPGRAREVVEDLSSWRPVDNSLGLLRRAWFLSDSAQIPHWDALIVAAAERSGASILLSEDFQAGRTFGAVSVVNPFHTPPPAA
ncbi:MAG: PIN domain-containing protein [Acidobacteria bacterium]|nr:PIN domain-containing protein [Acidobacteriota bacterium]